MREDFENVKSQVDIQDLATMLLGQPIRQMYRYPGEKTPSIKIYARTQSFFDFGRSVGGDCIKLWSHVHRCDSWTALKQIRALYGIEDVQDRENIRERIRQQERDREAAKQAEEERKEHWRGDVDFWKKISGACECVIECSEVFSDDWCWAINQRQLAEYRLDGLCGVLRGW